MPQYASALIRPSAIKTNPPVVNNSAIPTGAIFQGLTQDQVNNALSALGLPPASDPRGAARAILDLLVNSVDASGDTLVSYTACRDVEIIDVNSARETYSFSVDMQIALINPVAEVPVVTTPDSSASTSTPVAEVPVVATPNSSASSVTP